MTTTEALILLYVEAEGPVTTDDIVDDLPIGKLTLHSILPRMDEQDQIEREGERVTLTA